MSLAVSRMRAVPLSELLVDDIVRVFIVSTGYMAVCAVSPPMPPARNRDVTDIWLGNISECHIPGLTEPDFVCGIDMIYITRKRASMVLCFRLSVRT